MSQEARFLQAREARTAAQQRPRRRQRHQDVNDFWTSFREDVDAWQGRLDALQSSRPTPSIAIQSLDELLEELQSLKRQCLVTSDSGPELPLADVRLLHKEFTVLATRLDQVRDEILPPTKFVFKRYRAAIQQQQAAVQQQEPKIQQGVATESKAPPSRLSLAGNVIQNHCDSTVVVETDGSLRVHRQGVAESLVRQEKGDVSSSLLLQNLERCQVTINGSYKALHIQHLSQCTIQAVNEIDGAIHVTACHHVKLQATCHQLRMHESNALELHVQVGSGPILEDCTDIVFYACGGSNDLVYDAKDFNWLRNGVPSPNFRVVQAKETQESEKIEAANMLECISESPNPTGAQGSGEGEVSGISASSGIQSVHDDDEDDEL